MVPSARRVLLVLVAGAALALSLAFRPEASAPIGAEAVRLVTVTGVPEQGADELREALRVEVRKYVLPGSYLLDVWVRVHGADPDGVTVRVELVWLVRTTDGTPLGTITLANRVPLEHLRGRGARVWRAAAAGVVGG